MVSEKKNWHNIFNCYINAMKKGNQNDVLRTKMSENRQFLTKIVETLFLSLLFLDSEIFHIRILDDRLYLTDFDLIT
jgi:hypothetical protein